MKHQQLSQNLKNVREWVLQMTGKRFPSTASVNISKQEHTWGSLGVAQFAKGLEQHKQSGERGVDVVRGKVRVENGII